MPSKKKDNRIDPEMQTILDNLRADIRTFAAIKRFPDYETSVKTLCLFDLMTDNDDIAWFCHFVREADPEGQIAGFLALYIDLVRFPASRTVN